jgi:hypothetical protein
MRGRYARRSCAWKGKSSLGTRQSAVTVSMREATLAAHAIAAEGAEGPSYHVFADPDECRRALAGCGFDTGSLPRRSPHRSSPAGAAARPARGHPYHDGRCCSRLRARRRVRAADRRTSHLSPGVRTGEVDRECQWLGELPLPDNSSLQVSRSSSITGALRVSGSAQMDRGRISSLSARPRTVSARGAGRSAGSRTSLLDELLSDPAWALSVVRRGAVDL